MKVLMVGVDKTSVGGMLTVVENFLNSKEYVEQCHPIYVATVINKSKFRKILRFIAAYFRIFFILCFKKIDIVHIHMAEKSSVYREGMIVSLARFFRKKTIIHFHGATVEPWYESLPDSKKKKVRKIFNNADLIFVLGKKWEEFFENIVPKEKIRVVYNAVTIPSINLYNQDAKNLMFLGVIVPRKGIDDLLLSFKNALPNIPTDIVLNIYGDDKFNNINQKIKDNGLTNRAFYQGWLSDGKEEVFKNTLLNILPSYNEGLPMTILETMAYGIPNISTNIAAIPEAIDDGKNGFLIDPGDTEQMTRDIIQVCNDAELRKKISDNAYEKAKKDFELTSNLRMVLGIYKEVLNEK